jgi:hypothetical protein
MTVPGLDPQIVPVIHVDTSPAMPVVGTRRLHRSEPSSRNRGEAKIFLSAKH